MGELALIREAGARRDLCQGEVAAALQELLCSFDAAQDDVLVRRQPGGRLELPGEVVTAEAGRRGPLPPGRARAAGVFAVAGHRARAPPPPAARRRPPRAPGRTRGGQWGAG